MSGEPPKKKRKYNFNYKGLLNKEEDEMLRNEVRERKRLEKIERRKKKNIEDIRSHENWSERFDFRLFEHSDEYKLLQSEKKLKFEKFKKDKKLLSEKFKKKEDFLFVQFRQNRSQNVQIDDKVIVETKKFIRYFINETKIMAKTDKDVFKYGLRQKPFKDTLYEDVILLIHAKCRDILEHWIIKYDCVRDESSHDPYCHFTNESIMCRKI